MAQTAMEQDERLIKVTLRVYVFIKLFINLCLSSLGLVSSEAKPYVRVCYVTAHFHAALCGSSSRAPGEGKAETQACYGQSQNGKGA